MKRHRVNNDYKQVAGKIFEIYLNNNVVKEKALKYR